MKMVRKLLLIILVMLMMVLDLSWSSWSGVVLVTGIINDPGLGWLVCKECTTQAKQAWIF